MKGDLPERWWIFTAFLTLLVMANLALVWAIVKVAKLAWGS